MPSEIKSIGTEQTFQQDITDFDYLKDVLLLTAQKLSFDVKQKGLYAHTVTLKITYHDMKSITRSKSGNATDKATTIYETAAAMFGKIERRAIRLVGISLSGFTKTPNLQLSLFDADKDDQEKKLDDTLMNLKRKYGKGIVKTANVLRAEKRVYEDE